jgi:NADPH-dependent curcumin reductase CurA
MRERCPQWADLDRDQVLLKRLFLSLDPAMRGWMRDIPSYIPPVALGAVMRGTTVSEVVASTSSKFRPGDIVRDDAEGGWSEYGVVDARACQRLAPLPPGLPLSAHLGVLGMTGLTAYFGLLRVGLPQAGETVLVSGAAGATGSVVCQIAKIKGCKVIGVAGGADKCEWLVRELGVDDAIDYKLAKGDPARFQTLLRSSLKKVSLHHITPPV